MRRSNFINLAWVLVAAASAASCGYDVAATGYGDHGSAIAGGSGPVRSLKIFVTNEGTNFGTLTGNLGGRSGADALCVTEYNANRSALGCTKIMAFASFSASDEIRDMPTNFNFSTSSTVKRADGTAVAATFSALISGAALSLSAAIAPTQIAQAWTGSSSDGSLNANNCTGFTNAAAGTGRSGFVQSTTSTYIDNANDGCGVANELFCLCY